MGQLQSNEAAASRGSEYYQSAVLERGLLPKSFAAATNFSLYAISDLSGYSEPRLNKDAVDGGRTRKG